jgi:glutamate dehydrogenase (NAD(P)+)
MRAGLQVTAASAKSLYAIAGQSHRPVAAVRNTGGLTADALARRMSQSSFAAPHIGGAFTEASYLDRISGSAFAGKFQGASSTGPLQPFLELMNQLDTESAVILLRALTRDIDGRVPDAIWGAQRALSCRAAVESASDHALLAQIAGEMTTALNAVAISDADRTRLGEALTTPERVHIRILRVPMDDGHFRSFLAYRVQHNSWRGENKDGGLLTGGGLRFHPEVNLNTVVMLATMMTLKNAAMGLKMGGSKGGIAFDPKDGYSAGELERIARSYARAFGHVIVMNRDKPAGDMGNASSVHDFMGWLQNELDLQFDAIARGTITSKRFNEELGAAHSGIRMRGIATAFGNRVATQTALDRLGWVLGEDIAPTMAIQGAGNAGLEEARLAIAGFSAGAVVLQGGIKVVAITDSRKLYRNDHGFTLEQLDRLERQKRDQLRAGEEPIPVSGSANQIWEVPAGIRVPAARHWLVDEHAIEAMATSTTAGMKFLISPTANDAFTPNGVDAAAAMERGGHMVALADWETSGGGVASSYREFQQNWAGNRFHTRTEEAEFLAAAMAGAVGASVERARADGITVREAAWQRAMLSMHEAMPV